MTVVIIQRYVAFVETDYVSGEDEDVLSRSFAHKPYTVLHYFISRTNVKEELFPALLKNTHLDKK